MSKDIECLIEVRDVLGEWNFRSNAVKIMVEHFISMIERESIEIERVDLLDRINLTLRSLGCKEFSYHGLRRYY